MLKLYAPARPAQPNYRQLLHDARARRLYDWQPERPLVTAGSLAVLAVFAGMLFILVSLPSLLTGAQ